MSTDRTTTLIGVFKSLRTSLRRPWTTAAALATFDDCLALGRAALAAEAKVAECGPDLALSLFAEDAADAVARADAAFEAFCRSGTDGSHLSQAARVCLAFSSENGDRLDAFGEWAWHLRNVADAYAATPGALGVAAAARLIDAADLIDAMVTAALDDQMSLAADLFDAMRGGPDGDAASFDLTLSIPESNLA